MWRLLVIGLMLMGLFIGAILSASAHDSPSGWSYPLECCSDRDCAEVDKAGYVTTSDGRVLMSVTTKFGTMTVDENTKRYDSKDSKLHACIYKYPDGAPRVICIFYPPGT